MKFILQWNNRPSGDAALNVRNADSLLQAFAGWEPPESISISEFVARADGRGGSLIVTTDDLNAIDYMVGQYTPWFDWDVHPVIDVAESAEHGANANAWAKQATG